MQSGPGNPLDGEEAIEELKKELECLLPAAAVPLPSFGNPMQKRPDEEGANDPRNTLIISSMKAIDEYDLREAFDALDADECLGVLNYAQVQMLYLGLGYTHPRRRMNQQDFRADAQAFGLPQDALSVEQVLQLFEKYKRNRNLENKLTFEALLGEDTQQQLLTAQHLLDAAAAVQVPLKPHVAHHMIAMAKGENGQHGTVSDNAPSQGLNPSEFVQYWDPPDP